MNTKNCLGYLLNDISFSFNFFTFPTFCQNLITNLFKNLNPAK